MISLISMMVMGLIIGVLAKLIMPGKDPGGIVVTAIIGMLGSLIGTWLGRTFLGFSDSYTAGIPMGIIGSLILLGAYRMLTGGRRAE